MHKKPLSTQELLQLIHWSRSRLSQNIVQYWKIKRNCSRQIISYGRIHFTVFFLFAKKNFSPPSKFYVAFSECTAPQSRSRNAANRQKKRDNNNRNWRMNGWGCRSVEQKFFIRRMMDRPAVHSLCHTTHVFVAICGNMPLISSRIQVACYEMAVEMAMDDWNWEIYISRLKDGEYKPTTPSTSTSSSPPAPSHII